MKELCQCGLKLNLIQESLLAIVTNNSSRQKLHCYLFPKIQKDVSNIEGKIKYEIPQFIIGMPDGFSVFSTIPEARQIKYYKEKYEKPLNKIENNDINNQQIEIEPKPTKEHNYCYICGITFEDYYLHVSDQYHFFNLKKFKKIFNKINMTFKRIIKNCNTQQFINNYRFKH